jgi:hypothetical protein
MLVAAGPLQRPLMQRQVAALAVRRLAAKDLARLGRTLQQPSQAPQTMLRVQQSTPRASAQGAPALTAAFSEAAAATAWACCSLLWQASALLAS